jgi:RHS repeat-associated protein
MMEASMSRLSRTWVDGRQWGRAGRVLLVSALLAVAAPSHAFHFPWDQGHDTTNSNDPPPPGPCEGPTCDDDCGNASRSPVYAALGHAIWRSHDVVLPGRPYLGVMRAYNSNDPVVGLFGNAWSACFDVALYPANKSGVQQRIYKAANGKRFVYEKQADGSFRTPAGRFESISEGPTAVTMTTLDGRRSVFALDGRLLERLDANGNRVVFSYDGAGRPTRMADVNGRFLDLAYNAAGLVDAVVDHGGRAWRYAYDAVGNLTSVTDPAGGVARYTWQAYRPPADANTYYQLLSVTDPSGVVVIRFTYSGNRVASYSEGANTITYTRSASNTATSGTVSQRDAMSVTTSFAYGALGLVTRDTDGIGGQTLYTYDANGRVTNITDALGRNWPIGYDALGRVTSSGNPLGQANAVQYSGSDTRPVRAVSPSGRVVSMSYDARGNLVSSTDATGAVSRIAYNAQGDAIGITNALDQTTAVSYSPIGLPVTVSDALGRTLTMGYDALGRVSSMTNAAGEVKRYGYDVLGRLTTITDPLDQPTSFAYDAAGRILSVTDAKGSATRYEYDGFGRRSAEVAPDGRRTSFAYRADNLLSSITWPDGTSISYAYDSNKRIVRETAGSEVITYTYNAVNRLTGASGPGGSVSYTYDAADRAVTETSGGRTLTSLLNAEGERVRLDFVGQVRSFTRDARGQATRIATAAGNYDFVYDPLGRRVQMSYPGGSRVDYSFDPAGRLASLAHAGAFNASYGYAFDAAGRITSTTGDGATWSYAYDALGRLTTAVQGTETYAYTLDPVGNFLDGGRTYDANHRIVADSAKDYSYDGRGNLTLERERTTGARTAYGWNVKNQLLQVQFFADGSATVPTRTLQYTYDPLGRRASKTDNGVVHRYVYDGDDVVAVLDAAGAVIATHEFSDEVDEPLAVTTGGVTRSLHANHIGSVVAVSDGASTTHTYRYGPYGQTLAGSSADFAPYRFTGREKDTDSLYHYRARYYSAALGRFIQPDPIGLAGGMNPYAYASGDPVSLTDPYGEIAPAVIAGAYARCVAQCMLISAASSAITGNCFDLGSTAADCALDCLNPLNWGGKSAAKNAARNAANKLPKPPTGKGAVPPSQRDPKRVWTKEENAKKLDQQGGNCANCGKPTDIDNAAGHHVDRHADGGKTDSGNHAVVCNPCHKDLHSGK